MFNVGDKVTVTKIFPKEQDLQLHDITSKCFGHILTVKYNRNKYYPNDICVFFEETGKHYTIPPELLKKVDEDEGIKEEKTEKITGRKIIQISTSLDSPNTGGTIIYALCDDGTLWYKNRGGGIWCKDVNIPQD